MDFLFLSFDPSGTWGSLSNWMISILPLMFFFVSTYWKITGPYNLFLKFMGISMNKELKPLFNNLNSMSFIPFIFFFVLMSYNLFGLIPYFFTPSSHIPLAIGLALPLWLGIQSWSLLYFSKSWLSHLVPSGSPIGLAPFLVLVEFISNIIRPLTLSIRLVANMFAGHMILSLAGEGSSLMTFMIFLLVPLVILELAVAMIQSFVFSLLSSLYASEFI